MRRRKGLGYALRLPGPSCVAGAVAALFLLVIGFGGGAPLMAALAAVPAAIALWIWRSRDFWRDNADDWLNRRDGAL